MKYDATYVIVPQGLLFIKIEVPLYYIRKNMAMRKIKSNFVHRVYFQCLCIHNSHAKLVEWKGDNPQQITLNVAKEK